ncbi:virulence factor BrkB family protein [Gilliamella sp. ESL0232]|uniref:virulence factor BrkB family protein n=2 Tax=unclassified Gilliamella TaxID=2685620 RepID=UPI001580B258|nr:virulence factor BrkB family protein [Gilliamella sp. ESL0232]
MRSMTQIQIFIKMLWNRINHDRLTTSSAGLAYTTILALVPLITVIFSLLSAFPMFDEISHLLKQLIYNNLVPTASDTIQNYLEQFISNTKKMTFVGVIGLIVTSLLLINSINTALNHIWQTKRKRSFMYNLTMYWTILTLGPILIGSSIAISSYIFSLKWLSTATTGNILLNCLPFIISVIGFWLLYSIIPTESVPLKESMIGAFVAAALFEIGKRAFALYVTSFPTYQLIYGVVSSIPIMLVWIYFSWCIVLFGAEFAATLTDYNRQKKHIVNNPSLPE